MEQLAQLNSAVTDLAPNIDPGYLNLEYWFYKLLELFRVIVYLDFPFADAFKTLLSICAIIFLIMIAYYSTRIKEIKKTPEILFVKDSLEEEIEKTDNQRWQKVLEFVKSEESANWRLAILEADNMLDDLLKSRKYEGENLGERLKNVNPDGFNTLDYAWQAHKIRNQIAHEGTNFILTRHDANRTISLFERVFREFEYI